MKVLIIHSDYITVEATKKAIKDAETIKEELLEVKDSLVVFTATEKEDEGHEHEVALRLADEARKLALQLKEKTVVLYPYVHLTSTPSNPRTAQAVLKETEKNLSREFNVHRAPFGWYKVFEMKTKGHPLSESSRNINIAQENASLKREAKDENFTMSDKKLSKAEQQSLTAAAMMGRAITETYKNTAIGSIGLYHHYAYVDISGIRIGKDEAKKALKKAKSYAGKKGTFKKTDKKTVQNTWQNEILNDLGKKGQAYEFEGITIVPQHQKALLSCKDIETLIVVNTGSAYWKNNEKNAQLARIYVAGFKNEKEQESFEKEQEEAENRSHIKIGKELGLFAVSNIVGPGLPLIAPNGMIIRNEIANYLWELHKNKGYSQVWTPHIAKPDLYKRSGHWDKFGDELFKVRGKTDEFIMKPMNCPHHMQLFDSFTYSYRDLPVRFFEPATIYRDEKSGQLHGLSRVRAITQDDGHIFCRMSQVTEEVKVMVSIVSQFYKTLGMNKDYWVSLSTRGSDKSKYLGTEEGWKVAVNALEKAAKECALPFRKVKGEAAFYGPKLDFMFKDALGREWQLATIQCDFCQPHRFQLHYINEKNEKEEPVVLHRAISGSLERFMSVLIEHFAGRFPLWLQPRQVTIATVTDRANELGEKVRDALLEEDIRVQLDNRNESIGKKIREAQLQQSNYILVLGDKEVEQGTISIRTRADTQHHGVTIKDFTARIVKEYKQRTLESFFDNAVIP